MVRGSSLNNSKYSIDNIVLTEEAIRNRCVSENTFSRGVTYYKRGAVVKLDEMSAGNLYHGVVAGGEQAYEQVLAFNKYGILERSKCDCLAFASYPGHCKHIVASLLALKDYVAGRYVQKLTNEQEVERILESYQQANNSSNLQELKLELLFRHEQYRSFEDGKCSLSLKIGGERTYVVADIEKFLAAIYHKREYEFSKKLTYIPWVHTFNPNDQQVIDLLLEIYEYETEALAARNSKNISINKDNSISRNIFAGKSVQLPRNFALRLFELLQGSFVSIEFSGQLYDRVPVFKADLPISFDISLQNNELQLAIASNKDVYPLLRDGQIYLYNEIIYLISKEQNSLLLPIIQSFHRLNTESLTIPKTHRHMFVSSLLQQTKDRQQVKIAEDLASNIIRPTLQPQIYLDYRDGIISCDLQYHYGDMLVNPFDATAEPRLIEGHDSNATVGTAVETVLGDVILVRDIEAERRIMSFFEESNFQYNGNLMYIEDEQQMFIFLTEQLPILQKYVQVYYTDRFYNIERPRQPRVKGQIGINSEINVLEVGFDVEGISNEELVNVLQAIKEKHRYYRLKDGAFIVLEQGYNQELDDLAEMVTALNLKKSDLQKKLLQLPLNQALLIDDLQFSKDEAFQELTQRVRQPVAVDYQVPEQVQSVLRPYQKVGYQWFCTLADYGFGGILADDMGLGKTIQAISFILSLQQNNNKQLSMVIAPTSLVYNWQNEFAAFAPNLQVVVVSGNYAERQAQMEQLATADVIVTSYPLLRRDISKYVEMSFATCILDEAQFLKNHATQTAKAVKQLRARTCFALTGTPIENSITDLWSIFDIVLPGYFPSLTQFHKVYGSSDLTRLHKRVKPFVLRRLKRDVLKELPPKIENKLISVLTIDQKKLYLAYLEQVKGQVSDIIRHDGFNKGQIKILALLTRLRQICCHPALFVDNYQGESGKLLQLLELLSETIDSGHRVLIFSQFASMLHIIRDAIEKAGYTYFYLDGSTPAIERIDMANQFNEGKQSIFLISLKAGGTGLNLTGADTVILYDLWWNPAVEDQATDRAHRIGQDKVVQVIRLITQGTIEEKIYELQQKKRQMINEVIQSGEMLLSKLTEAEIRSLLDYS